MVSKIHSFTFQIHNFKTRPSSFQPQGPTLDLCLVNFTFQPLVYIMKQRHMRLGPEFNFVPWTIFGIRQDEWEEEKFHCLAISIVNCRKFIFKHPNKGYGCTSIQFVAYICFSVCKVSFVFPLHFLTLISTLILTLIFQPGYLTWIFNLDI